MQGGFALKVDRVDVAVGVNERLDDGARLGPMHGRSAVLHIFQVQRSRIVLQEQADVAGLRVVSVPRGLLVHISPCQQEGLHAIGIIGEAGHVQGRVAVLVSRI